MRQNGYLLQYNKKDSTIGLNNQKIGAFQEVEYGGILFLSGYQVILNKL